MSVLHQGREIRARSLIILDQLVNTEYLIAVVTLLLVDFKEFVVDLLVTCEAIDRRKFTLFEIHFLRGKIILSVLPSSHNSCCRFRCIYAQTVSRYTQISDKHYGTEGAFVFSSVQISTS
jgi:hypothetical protein